MEVAVPIDVFRTASCPRGTGGPTAVLVRSRVPCEHPDPKRSLYFELSNGDNRIVARQAPVRRAGTPIGGPLLGGFAGPTADDIGGDFRVGFHQRHQLILQGAARDLHRFDRVVFLFSLDRGCRQF